MAERSIATDCKSVAQWATQVRILLYAHHHNHPAYCWVIVYDRSVEGAAGFEKVEYIARSRASTIRDLYCSCKERILLYRQKQFRIFGLFS